MLCCRALLARPACTVARVGRQLIQQKGSIARLSLREASWTAPPPCLLSRAFSSLSLSSRSSLHGHNNPISGGVKQRTPPASSGRELSTQAATASELPPNLVLADASILDALLKPQPAPPALAPPTSFEVQVQQFRAAQQDDKAPPPPPGETITLDARVFGVAIRKDIIHQVVTWQRAKRRCANASTKRVGEISGSTKKARQQKGSGRARAGKRRAPQWRGGYKPHGPRKERDFTFKLNKKVRALGLRTALSAKFLERNLVIVDQMDVPEAKTKLAAALIAKNDWGRTLLIDDEVHPNLALAVGNLQSAHVLPHIGANVLDIVKAQTLVISRAALEALTARLTEKL